jgi:ABC-type transport system involved in multi-copper enzyme maturation permease subunit
MLRREISITVRQTVFILWFYILIPLLVLLDRSVYRTGLTVWEYISNGIDLFILITALFLAYNMFRNEEEEGASEYLLSLPMNRWKLMGYKIIPRILILFILLIIGLVLNGIRQSEGSALGCIFINWRAGLFYLAGFMAFIQVCGFTLGLVGRSSWSVRLLLLFMVVCVWQFSTISLAIERIIYKVADMRSAVRFSFWFGNSKKALLDFSVFFALIWYILKPLSGIWDLNAMRVREIWFQKRMILPMTAFLLLFLNRFLVISYLPFISYY